MDFETFFRIEIEEACPEGLSIKIRPTRYVWRLHPYRAMAELEAYIDTLYEALSRHGGPSIDEASNKQEALKKTRRRMLFELETCEDYLAQLKEQYKTIH
jgi:hypothetical protein